MDGMGKITIQQLGSSVVRYGSVLFPGRARRWIIVIQSEWDQNWDAFVIWNCHMSWSWWWYDGDDDDDDDEEEDDDDDDAYHILSSYMFFYFENEWW